MLYICMLRELTICVKIATMASFTHLRYSLTTFGEILCVCLYRQGGRGSYAGAGIILLGGGWSVERVNFFCNFVRTPSFMDGPLQKVTFRS